MTLSRAQAAALCAAVSALALVLVARHLRRSAGTLKPAKAATENSGASLPASVLTPFSHTTSRSGCSTARAPSAAPGHTSNSAAALSSANEPMASPEMKVEVPPPSRVAATSAPPKSIKSSSTGKRLILADEPVRSDGDKRFSLLSYNMLSYKYCSSNSPGLTAKSPGKLDWRNRRELILATLKRSECDVICLQEAEMPTFARDFGDEMEELGYGYVLQMMKNSKKKKAVAPHTTGVVTLYRKSKFRVEWPLQRSRILLLGLKPLSKDHSQPSKPEEEQQESRTNSSAAACLSSVETPANANEGATGVASSSDDSRQRDRVTGASRKHGQSSEGAISIPTTEEVREHCVQEDESKPTNGRESIGSLETLADALPDFSSPSSRLLYVANCHLSARSEGHPAVENVRFNQLRSLFQKLKLQHQRTNEVSSLSRFIVCGDFNSTADGRVFELMSTGKLKGGTTDPFYPEVVITDKDYAHPYSFRHAYQDLPEGDYSTFCRGAPTPHPITIDFIWYNSQSMRNVATREVCSPPELELIRSGSGIPNYEQPSDHMPVAALFEYKSKSI